MTRFETNLSKPNLLKDIYDLIAIRAETLEKLEEFVHELIRDAIKSIVQTGEFSQVLGIEISIEDIEIKIDFLPGVSDFTSFLRLVKILNKKDNSIVKIVAKLAFDKTQPRILQELIDPNSGVNLSERLSDKTRSEFERTKIIFQDLATKNTQGIVPEGIFCFSLPGGKGGTVVFYELIEGLTLEELVLSCAEENAKTGFNPKQLFFEVGRLLAIWHSSSSLAEGSLDDRFFKNDTNRIKKYQQKFPDPNSLLLSMVGIFEKWASLKKALDLIENSKFVETITFIWSTINQNLETFLQACNTPLLCHGDFKPENIIVAKATGQTRICFIDNDAFYGLPWLDLFKMISRTVPILLRHPELKQLIFNCLSNFLDSYFSNISNGAQIDESNLFLFNRLASVFIALDLISILDSYSVIIPGRLQFYPFLSNVFLGEQDRSLVALLNAIYAILNLDYNQNFSVDDYLLKIVDIFAENNYVRPNN